MINRRIGAVAAFGALLLTLAACSSSGDDNGTDAPTGSVQSGAGSTLLPTPSKPASGTPLKVFYINEQGASATASDPSGTFAAKAATSYINKNLGGIHGRPISLTTCFTLGTAASSANCANKAVDMKADIVIKGVDPQGEAAVPIVTSAGIPYMTLNAGAAAELDNPLSFVPTSGYSAEFGSFAPYAKSKGFKSAVAIFTNVTSLASAVSDMSKVFSEQGISFASEPVDITTGDLTPAYTAALTKKPDLIIVLASLAQCTATLQARQSLSDDTLLAAGPSCQVPSVLSSIPAASLGNVLFAAGSTSIVPDDKDTLTYLAAMKAYQPSGDTGGLASDSFAAIMDFYNAAMTVDDPTTLNSKSIGQLLETAKSIPLFAGAGKSYSCSEHYFAKQPSACSPWAFLANRAPDGKVSLVGSYDMSTLLH
jgi:branched-chain amino acid transport system substrate-binding protein